MTCVFGVFVCLSLTYGRWASERVCVCGSFVLHIILITAHSGPVILLKIQI